MGVSWGRVVGLQKWERRKVARTLELGREDREDHSSECCNEDPSGGWRVVRVLVESALERVEANEETSRDGGEDELRGRHDPEECVQC